MERINLNRKMKTPTKSHLTVGKQDFRNYAHKRPDANTEEFVRFITKFQPEKQLTNLRLEKKAPLPEIGNSKLGLRDSGFLDKNSDLSDYDENLLDNEVASVISNTSKNSRKDSHIQEVLTLTREQTMDNFLNKTLANGFADHLNGNILFSKHSTDNRKKLTNMNSSFSKANRRIKQLPPIEQKELPDRPTAPSPCQTPPLSVSDDSYEEPIDYIDSS